jgi:hypothetical protein
MIVTKLSADQHLSWLNFAFNKSRVYLGVVMALQYAQEKAWEQTAHNEKP